jgi:hypothetical protein
MKKRVAKKVMGVDIYDARYRLGTAYEAFRVVMRQLRRGNHRWVRSSRPAFTSRYPARCYSAVVYVSPNILSGGQPLVR